MAEQLKAVTVICRLLKIGLLLSIFSTLSVAELDQCSSMNRLYRNMDMCDGQNVSITGKVTDLQLSTSERGNKYTTFMLDDATATPIKVFTYTHLTIFEGDVVKVSGTFNKVVVKENYTFPMQINTIPENVFVLRSPKSLLNKLLPIITTVFVIGVILFLYRRYRKHKTSADTRYEIGSAFEHYVQSLFDMGDWTIATTTGDLSRKLGRKVESDSDPDIVMRHKDTNTFIAIECKYSSLFTHGTMDYGVHWAAESQMKNYNVFREKTRYPVFIAIGVGGLPSKPEQLFLVPLYCLTKSGRVTREYLKKFERSTKNEFTLEEFKKLDRTV